MDVNSIIRKNNFIIIDCRNFINGVQVTVSSREIPMDTAIYSLEELETKIKEYIKDGNINNIYISALNEKVVPKEITTLYTMFDKNNITYQFI